MEPLGPDDPQVLGPYRLAARLGAGGMGRVYLARTPEGRILAVKAIRPELMGDRNFRIRFRREVEAAGAVGGRFTAPVVDADPDGATPWLATEYIAGPTLAEAVAKHGPLPVESVLVLGAGIAEALISVQAAGLVHRDLKPSNVLLAADGPRVIDFGIVRATDGYDLTRSGALFGSFEYMCPEQATGEPLGPEGDIFSLGSVLTYAASGHAPFSGTAAATLLYQVVHSPPDLTGVPDPLDKIINLCLTKDPRLRITPDKLAAACAPGGVEQMTEDGWLPPPVTTSIALRTAALETLGTTPGAPAGVPSAGADERVAYANDPVPYAYGQGPDDTPVPRPLRDSGAPYASSSDRPGCADEAPIVADPPGPAPYAVPGDITPDGPTSPGHRRGLPRPGPSRRTVLAASAGATAVAVGAALLLTRGEEPAAQSVLPLGPAPKPAWTFRSGPLLQAPAVFREGTALVKSRPGDMLCLDLKDGTRPKWVYEGISTSATPAILTFDAAVALGEGSTVIGIDPADGTERFTLDFGPDFRFDTLLGRTSDRALAVIGVRLQRESEDQGNATSTDTVFSVDLASRRAEVNPIDPEDVGIRLMPVIIPGYFVYADGLRNVTVRSTETSGVVWRHPVGYDLRPGLAVLDRTVFAIGRELRALNLLDGKDRWRVKPHSGQFASLGAQGNTVYVTGTNPSGVYAFNAATGTRRWFCPTPRLNVDLPITAGPEVIYVPAYKNRNGFYAIDAARGRLLWNFTDGVETGVNQWQLAVDGTGRLVAQHYDRTYGFAAP